MTDYGCSGQLPVDDKRQEVYRVQRLERGFDDSETWNLDGVIAKFILPRLIRFKEVHVCHPDELSMDEWDAIIQKMIDAFGEVVRSSDNVDWDCEKVEVGLKLFAEWYSDLWW